MGPKERVLLGYRNPADGCDGLVALLKASTAFVVRAVGRIGANDQKIPARLQRFVSNTCGHNNYIASGDLHRLSFVSAKAQHRRTSSNSRYLVNHGVVM